jgi:porin
MDVQPLTHVKDVAIAVLLLTLVPTSAIAVPLTSPLGVVQADDESPLRVALQRGESPETDAVPGRPLRPEDEQAELTPPSGEGRGERAERDGDVPAAQRRDEGEEAEAPETLLGSEWHRVGSITAESLYTGEVFNNTRGGIRTADATRYRGNLDLYLRLDTEEAGWWEHGRFYIYAGQSHGETLSQEFVGDGQLYSNIDTSPEPPWLTQLGEYGYEHRFFDDTLLVRVGKLDSNDDFAFADLAADFLNSSFATLTNVALPHWPLQTLGLTSLYQPHERLRLGGGFYDQGPDVGQWWATNTSRGMCFLGQVDYMPFGDDASAPLTIVRGGAWYASGDTLAVDGSEEHPGNFGFYTTIDRMLLPEPNAPEQGLGAFFQYCWAPPDRNRVDNGFGAGLVYTGLLAGREIDTCGTGFSLIEFSNGVRQLTGQTYENALETFYKARFCDWLAITADLQYIANPDGDLPDAMVAGMRFEIGL